MIWKVGPGEIEIRNMVRSSGASVCFRQVPRAMLWMGKAPPVGLPLCV